MIDTEYFSLILIDWAIMSHVIFLGAESSGMQKYSHTEVTMPKENSKAMQFAIYQK